MSEKPRIVIEYCTGCRWLLRAAWMAQELLTTFEGDLAEVALAPESESGGVYRIWLGGVGESILFDRAVEGRFPEAKEMKQRVRDAIAPGRDLGHTDR